MGENADIVRRGFEAIKQGDLASLLADLHEDVQWRPLLSHAPGEDTFVGHEGVEQWWRRVREIFPDIDVHIEELVEHGDCVYVAGTLGTASVPGLHQPMAWVMRLRDAKTVRMDVFQDRSEARRAAGLD